MNFAKSNIRISLSLSPGEHLMIDDRLLHQKTLKILSADNPRPLCSSPWQITATDISLWISVCTCHSHDHSSSLLLLQDASKYSPLSWESFEFTVLQFYLAWKPLRLFPYNYRGSVLLNCSYVSLNSSEYFLTFRKFSAASYSWNSYLLGLWLIPYD